MIAALFVEPRGVYAGLPDVELWPRERDARLYMGPHPVVAHPPCERWGRFWWADGSERPGNDDGCFASALDAVRTFGGVLEHPEGSQAWRAFDLPTAQLGAWARGICGGWSTTVAQSAYGHRAVKLTWLYYVGDAAPPALDWTVEPTGVYLSQPGRCSKGKPRRRCGCARCRAHFGDAWDGAGRVRVERMGHRERLATPPAFRDLLLSIARSARAKEENAC